MSLERALIKMASENPDLAEDVIDLLAAAEEDEDFFAGDDEDEDFFAGDDEDMEEDEEADMIEAMLRMAAAGSPGASKSKYNSEDRGIARQEGRDKKKQKASGNKKKAFARLLTYFLTETQPAGKAVKKGLEALRKIKFDSVKDEFQAWAKERAAAGKARADKEDGDRFESNYGKRPSSSELKSFRNRMTRGQSKSKVNRKTASILDLLDY